MSSSDKIEMIRRLSEIVSAPEDDNTEGILLTEIRNFISGVSGLDLEAQKGAAAHWNSLAKPIGSLGILEEDLSRIAGVTGSPEIRLDKKEIAVFCADNGVVREGVTQTGQDVTSIVAGNIQAGKSTVTILGKKEGIRVFPVDVGMAYPAGIREMKDADGTADIAEGPAMTPVRMLRAVSRGMMIAGEMHERGVDLAAAGEMGIGNTTTSSAIASVLLNLPPEEVTGRGAGLDHDGFRRKIQVIKKAVRINDPDPGDPFEVLWKLGGFDIAAMCGFYIGCAGFHIPVILDGFISGVAALTAAEICPAAVSYMLASHCSSEPAAGAILEKLGLEAPYQMRLHTGEGCGAVFLMGDLEKALMIYRTMVSFEDTKIEAYVPYDEQPE